MNELRFTAYVEGRPISVNRMYRRGRHGGMYLSDEAAAWEATIGYDVRVQIDCAALRAAWACAGHPSVRVDLTLYGVRGDVDNYAKALCDGLKATIGIDDRHFSPVSARRGERLRANGKLQPPGALIELWIPEIPEIPEPAPAQPEPALELRRAPGSLRMKELVEAETLARIQPVLERMLS